MVQIKSLTYGGRLLIVPYGIETFQRLVIDVAALAFNRTLWN